MRLAPGTAVDIVTSQELLLFCQLSIWTFHSVFLCISASPFGKSRDVKSCRQGICPGSAARVKLNFEVVQDNFENHLAVCVPFNQEFHRPINRPDVQRVRCKPIAIRYLAEVFLTLLLVLVRVNIVAPPLATLNRKLEDRKIVLCVHYTYYTTKRLQLRASGSFIFGGSVHNWKQGYLCIGMYNAAEAGHTSMSGRLRS